jgi:hypothetical protein
MHEKIMQELMANEREILIIFICIKKLPEQTSNLMFLLAVPSLSSVSLA